MGKEAHTIKKEKRSFTETNESEQTVKRKFLKDLHMKIDNVRKENDALKTKESYHLAFVDAIKCFIVSLYEIVTDVAVDAQLSTFFGRQPGGNLQVQIENRDKLFPPQTFLDMLAFIEQRMTELIQVYSAYLHHLGKQKMHLGAESYSKSQARGHGASFQMFIKGPNTTSGQLLQDVSSSQERIIQDVSRLILEDEPLARRETAGEIERALDTKTLMHTWKKRR